ncbi:MAG: hypothetical protein LBQ15_06425 [Clostridium sp.]|jgi:hypothetical protein|nr:hypothetical protein [Clostridium sp.]
MIVPLRSQPLRYRSPAAFRSLPFFSWPPHPDRFSLPQIDRQGNLFLRFRLTRQEADIIGTFLSKYTVQRDNSRLSTSELYSHYAVWAKDNGYRSLSNRPFATDLRRRFEVRHNGKAGNFVVGLALSFDPGLR